MDQNRYIHTTNVHNRQAAIEVVPIIMNLFNPSSVADLGCGLGTWLQVFNEMGVREIAGYDGTYVDLSKLCIERDFYFPVDLEKPLIEKRRFDLVLSLEVAEHLKPESAELFVQSLVRLSDILVFSAAVPGQGGQHHINEQWPSWWAQLFEKQGYQFYDIFRPQIWNNQLVDWWYRQNMFLVTKPSVADKYNFTSSCRALIHPELFSNKLRKIDDFELGKVSLPVAWNVLKRSFFRALGKRIS